MKLTRFTGLLAGLLVLASTLSAGTPVGQFAESADIGAPEIAGSTSYDASIQQYRMSGAGINMWGTTDQHQFAWNKLKGDWADPINMFMSRRMCIGCPLWPVCLTPPP